MPDAQINLVYLTEVSDTRFDAFGVLRPLPIGVTTQLPPEGAAEEEPEDPEQPQEEPVEPAGEEPEPRDDSDDQGE